MSSIASRYEPSSTYHHVLPPNWSGTSSRNGTPTLGAPSGPTDDGDTPPRPRSRTHEPIEPPQSKQSLGGHQQQLLLLNNNNSANQKPQQRDKRRNVSRYRRSATLSPAAGARRNRNRYYQRGSDSSDSDDEDSSRRQDVTYPLLSPVKSPLAGGGGGGGGSMATSYHHWIIQRRPSNLANSKRSASPMQTHSAFAHNGRNVQKKPDLPRFARSSLLRKTCSEPTDLFIDECDRNKVEKIHDILNSLDFTKFHLHKRGGGGKAGGGGVITRAAPSPGPASAIPSITSPLSPSNSQSSYASGRSSPLVTPSQSPDETWATPRGSLFIPSNHQSPDRPSAASLALTRLILKQQKKNAAAVAHESHLADEEDDSDFMSTDIEELREAAQTIEALSRRTNNRRRPSDLLLVEPTAVASREKSPADGSSPTPTAPQSMLQMSVGDEDTSSLVSSSASTIVVSINDDPDGSKLTISADNSSSTTSLASSSTTVSSTLPRRSGITTRLGGQPRGVMQFLPSVKSSELLSKTAYESYLANKTRRAYQTQPTSRSSACSSNDSSILDVNAAAAAATAAQLLRRKVSMPDQLYQAGQDTYRYQGYRQMAQYNQLQDAQGASAVIADQNGIPDELDLYDRKMSAPASSMSSSTVDTVVAAGNRYHQTRFNSFRTPDSSSTAASQGRNSKLLRQFSQQYSDNSNHNEAPATTGGLMTIETSNCSSPPPPPLIAEGLVATASTSASFKGVDSLGSFSRFGRLLKSLRTSRQNSPELEAANAALSPASSDSPLSSPCPSERSPSTATITGGGAGGHHHPHHHHHHRKSSEQQQLTDSQQIRPRSQAATVDASILGGASGLMSQSWHGGVSKMHSDLNTLAAAAGGSGAGCHAVMSDSDSSMLQADLLLWQKRSKGSLRRHQDTRTHIVKELYDTEASYVENLQLIVHKYLRPLKRPELCTLIDPMLVDEIFFQIPEVLGHHELFFAALKSRLDNWDNRQKIGDIILNNFTKQSVIDTYTAFINNWKNAKHAIRSASHAKPSFAKYLERCSREHKNKLTLDALLIMPVQRIPRYELLIKELLKHTSVEHPDHPLLLRAQKEIHELATKINHVEQEAGLAEQMQQRLREIEAIVDGLDDLVSVDRVFYRYDLVSVSTHGGKKERCLFLFSDQLIITNVKRKSAGALRKMPSVTPSSTNSCNFLESNKFKLLMKISLDDLETTKNNSAMLHKIQEEISQLQEDLRVLGKVSELLLLLKTQHDDVEKEVEKIKDLIRKQLAEKHHEMTTNPLLTSLDLLVTTEAGVETLAVTYQSADKRVAWEKCFNDAKEALALSLSRRPPPVFLKPIAAQRTRSGLHFTCAAPTFGRNEHGYPNVWICNSDGYVGQVCVMTLTPEADLSCCNGITNSRILCICPVPDAKHSSAHRRSRKSSTAATSPTSQASSSAVDSGYNLELDSDSSDNESGGGGVDGTSKSNASNGGGPPRPTPIGPSGSSSGVSSGEPAEQAVLRKKSHKDSAAGSSNASGDQQAPAGTTEVNPQDDLLGPTMWLGTEDGCVHIFNYNDSVRTRKNKLKIQHGASVLVISHADDRVFVALGDGSLLYYDRDQDGRWDLEHFKYIEMEQLSRGPISAMLGVTNRMWLGVRNRICVLNPHSLKLEHVFQASSDVDSNVGCMATSGLGVWFSMQGSPVIKLHHAHSYECLLEVNVSPIVTKTLAGCDDIIRQHKLSCLRVTTLLCCKDYLWIGTSAGVLLHLGLPHITHNTTRLNNTPALSSVPLGHCGQCRFLTSVELMQPSQISQSSSRAGSFTTINELSRRRMSLNVASLQQGKVYVISGGDGFEDFQDIANDEGDDNTGRDDSTNHILIWQS